MPYSPGNLDEYFAPLSAALGDLAQCHGLVIERYCHDSPSWSLCFGHPRGGQAKVDVSAESEQLVAVQAVWWVDDYPSFTRSLRWGAKHLCERAAAPVALTARRSFADALAWLPGDWSQVATGYESSWSAFTAEAFASFAKAWPTPTNANVT